MSSPNANVRRDGHVITVKSDELVPGDIVLLEAGMSFQPIYVYWKRIA